MYRQALQDAGLAADLDIQLVAPNALPDEAQLAGAEMMLTWLVPPGVLAKMPRLKWVQTPNTGVAAWLKRPDLRADIAHQLGKAQLGPFIERSPLQQDLGALVKADPPADATGPFCRRWRFRRIRHAHSERVEVEIERPRAQVGTVGDEADEPCHLDPRDAGGLKARGRRASVRDFGGVGQSARSAPARQGDKRFSMRGNGIVSRT